MQLTINTKLKNILVYLKFLNHHCVVFIIYIGQLFGFLVLKILTS